MSKLRIPITYLAQIENYLNAQGVDTGRWLAQRRLKLADLKNPQKQIDYADYESLILTAAALDGREDVGLRIGHHLRINQHGALGFAILSSNSLQESLQLLSRYIKTRTPLVDLSLTNTGQQCTLLFTELHDFSRIKIWFMEALVVALCNVFRFISPTNDVIDVINLPFAAPVYQQKYAEYIPCKFAFGHRQLEIKFTAKAAVMPLDGDVVALEQAKMLCESEFQQWYQERLLSERVSNMLFANCALTLAEVSQRLHVTTRTLHRKLQKEHTSFHQIQDKVRHALAKQYLGTSQSSIKQVAYILGYSDVANFRRAFKRWEGNSPVEYRQKLT